MKPKKPQKAPSTFRAAVQATPSIASAYRPGIQALLPADRKRLANAEHATGSVALDEALADQHPNANRWDYGVGLPGEKTERVLWLEVHHAASGEADRVLKKLQWLRSWLRNEAPRLDRLPPIFIWLLSNVENNPNDRRKRNALAEKHGLRRHQGVLDLARLAD